MVDLYQEPATPTILRPGAKFTFACGPEAACFGECCRQATVMLKPYDILRLRRRLGITSGEFLNRYTTKLQEDRSHLPLVFLRLDATDPPGCPFLQPGAGCEVYQDRPEACRLFPVTRGSRLVQNEIEDHYFLKQLDCCQGFAQGPAYDLAAWKQAQGLEAYELLNQGWLEIVLKRGELNPPADDARAPALFQMVAYDLDQFRRFVFETAFLNVFEIPAPVAEILKNSDVELLRFGYKYLKMALLIEDALQMREEMKQLPQPADPSLTVFFF